MNEKPKETPETEPQNKPPHKPTRREKWKAKTTSSKVFAILRIAFLTVGVLAMLFYLFGRQIFGNEFGDAIYGEGANGWDFLISSITSSSGAWFLTFIYLAVASVFSILLDIIVRLVSPRSRRGKTISSLVKSLLHYAIVIITLGLILTAWGVNVAGIVAGVGIITLVVGLGCQSLVQDVVSGLFIVFDDYFAVGDVVIIDGFRGTVTYVGLRTTKLEDAGGNIKSITNSSISTVANLARIDSLAKVEMTAAYEEDVHRVEAIIATHLDDIRKKIPAITAGPFYKGISSFGDAGINYLIIANCKEADRFQVTRDMNREFYLLFVENNVNVPFNQITVNTADTNPRPKASPAEMAVSKKATDALRGTTAPKKQKASKSVIKKVGESIREAALQSFEDDGE
ncbi:MAG: mechanosensitive ion channel family protein [Candidatus Enteromonas sp.]|nr:mechanosensitive ion channel family protein [Candidatus Enteromonas sp.]